LSRKEKIAEQGRGVWIV